MVYPVLSNRQTCVIVVGQLINCLTTLAKFQAGINQAIVIPLLAGSDSSLISIMAVLLPQYNNLD